MKVSLRLKDDDRNEKSRISHVRHEFFCSRCHGIRNRRRRDLQKLKRRKKPVPQSLLFLKSVGEIPWFVEYTFQDYTVTTRLNALWILNRFRWLFQTVRRYPYAHTKTGLRYNVCINTSVRSAFTLLGSNHEATVYPGGWKRKPPYLATVPLPKHRWHVIDERKKINKRSTNLRRTHNTYQ